MPEPDILRFSVNICEINGKEESLNINVQDLLVAQCASGGFSWHVGTGGNSQIALGTVPRTLGSTSPNFVEMQVPWSHATGFH